jgi:hypothetical protein
MHSFIHRTQIEITHKRQRTHRTLRTTASSASKEPLLGSRPSIIRRVGHDNAVKNQYCRRLAFAGAFLSSTSLTSSTSKRMMAGSGEEVESIFSSLSPLFFAIITELDVNGRPTEREDGEVKNAGCWGE